MIRAYPGQASVAPGDRLTLHVATDAPRFRVSFFRWRDGPELLERSSWLPGADAADGPADTDWHWPAYTFAIPADWPSSVVIAHCEGEGQPRSFDLAARHGAALFIVRGRRRGHRSGMLYKLPLATYHAYNDSGGACFYHAPPRSQAPPGARVSLRRPGGGIGGPVWGAPDHYDSASPRQTFAHWDARFVRWLARNDYEADVCTDLDLHADPGLLDGYRLLVSAGHDEYWSAAMRDAVEAFVAAGGNLALFAGNVCWWRIHLVDDGTAMVCHQGGPQGALDHWWAPTGAARPEDSLTGVSYRHGGGWWDGPRRCDGYAILEPEHWAFAGTGLARGDVLGKTTWPPLPGYECDGVAPKGTGPPDGYELLAAAPLNPDWQELPAREHEAAGAGAHMAALGLFTRNGRVFSAGCTDWAQVLGCARDRKVERITRNVLDNLLAP